MNDSITSIANERVKKLVKLRESAKKSKQEKLFVVEGSIDLKLIIECGRSVEEIYYCKNVKNKENLYCPSTIYERIIYCLAGFNPEIIKINLDSVINY